jgi:hypothetical protein
MAVPDMQDRTPKVFDLQADGFCAEEVKTGSVGCPIRGVQAFLRLGLDGYHRTGIGTGSEGPAIATGAFASA